MAQFPTHPKHPERICWGCEKFCPADDLCCGNGTIRSPHPVEIFGQDWVEWLDQRENLNAGPPPVAANGSPEPTV
jgi:hypothetical protein